jgi:phosphoribosylaminoimidazole-succinocarboxamide synthase
MSKVLTKIELPGLTKKYSGKVRDIYEVDEKHFLIVATDRVSAFDHIFPNGIPGKGLILNQISNLWFSKIDFINNHLVETNFNKFPKPFSNFPELLKDRSVIVKKTDRIDFECVARGYIIGSGWKDYQETQAICGIKLPVNLKLAEKLPESIFTPAQKEDQGHDVNVSADLIEAKLGEGNANLLKEMTLKIFNFGQTMMEAEGIILADTKFEFGFWNNEIILIDEILTPDSSRFWEKSTYEVGKSPISYDKQFIRDYLETTSWDKNSSPPPLPDEIVQKTAEKYKEIFLKIKKSLGE